jgi:hypothetical protein
MCWQLCYGQLGGQSTYKALALPSAPRITALGGNALGIYDNDINLAIDNPAYIQEGLNSQLTFSNNFYLAGINYGTMAYAHHFERAGNMAWSMKYVSYGQFSGRDVSGTFTGDFRAGDYIMQAGYGDVYKEKFLYGANLKLVYSHLETYNSFGVAIDLAGAYHNAEKDLTVTAILRNAGFQIVSYTGEEKENLPLELSVGFSKKFQNIPVRLNIVVHNLQKPDVSYEDPNAQTAVNIFGEPGGGDIGIVDKIFRHFIFGTEIDIARPLSVRFGYNHQVRQEIALSSKKGLAGITLGAGIHIKQFSIDYGFSKPHAATNINHLGLTVNLDEFLGRKSESEED